MKQDIIWPDPASSGREGKVRNKEKQIGILSLHSGQVLRWIASVTLAIAGLSATWAWGEMARMAEPDAGVGEPQPAVLYAAWEPRDGEGAALFRSTDEGAIWEALELPADSVPVAWAGDGGERVAVGTQRGALLLSSDRGDTWQVEARNLEILSLAWGSDGSLYVGTDRQGLYRLATGEKLGTAGINHRITGTQGELASARIVDLTLVEGRLFAATPTTLFYTDEVEALAAGGMAGSVAWTKSMPVPGIVTALAATDRHRVYVGTATSGVYRSADEGQTWQPAWEGLGLAAGQMVKVTALRADPREPGVLYAAVDHMVGGTQVQATGAGIFVLLEGRDSWQPLAGPAFPEADHAAGLVIAPGRALHVQAVTSNGLQTYAPDVAALLAELESGDAGTRAAAARQLGLARAEGVSSKLLAALDDPELAVSLAASEALGRIADPAAAPGLLMAIEHPHEQVRFGAARALGMMRVQASVEPLRAMFLQGEGLEVGVAGEALGRIGSPQAVDALLPALSDPAPTARWHVAMAALEEMGEPAVSPLIAMLDSPDAYARQSAAQALGWIGSPQATGSLVQALTKDRDPATRVEAAWALGEIGDAAARPALERAQLRDPVALVQAAAGRALATTPQQPASARGWPESWAPVLNQWQPVRWLILGLSLAGAAWLAIGQRTLSLAHLPRRISR